jgi:hypothetical protein
MRSLSTAELLAIWEAGLTKTSPNRALLLLACACPESTMEFLANISIGQRDSLLLALRDMVFGKKLNGQVICPLCGERLQFDFISSDIQIKHKWERQEEHMLSICGYEVRFRLPNNLDLASIGGIRDIARAERKLLDCCLRDAKKDGKEVVSDQLPEEVAAAISERMSQADPEADIQMNFTCALCGDKWPEIFDIVSFFWGEIDAWARRTLLDVHSLASAYGWSESDILAMSPNRRQIYLELSSG